MAHRVRQLVATVGVLGVGTVATGVPAIAATRDSVAVGHTGEIHARGAGLTLAVTYSCPSGEMGPFIGVQVTETVRGGIAGGFGSVSGSACDGRAHTVKVALSAQPGGMPFVPGTAFAVASLQTFNPTTGPGPGAQTHRTIALSR